ncbi:hypothetical protein D1872_348380 [compost metagenome]
MHQEVLGAEMTVKHARHQNIAQPPLETAAAVHELMSIDDAHRAGDDAHIEHRDNALEGRELRARHHP